jgi:S1-C subfamily serine protease
VLVLHVRAGSGAATAGIEPLQINRRGEILQVDLIVACDQVPVKTQNDLFRVLDQREIGDSVQVQIKRNNKTFVVDVTLQELSE